MNFPYEVPNSIGPYPPLSYYMGIKTGYFYFLFWAWDCPTEANVDPSSSEACIAALRSRGLYAITQDCVVGSNQSSKRNMASFKLISAHLMYLSLNPFI